MKKYKKTLIILGVILVLVAAAVVTVVLINQNNEQQQAEAEAATTVAISHPAAGEFTEFTYTFEGEPCTFALDDAGNWTYKDDAAYPLIADDVNSMADTIANLSAVKQVATGRDRFDDFGLTEPMVTIDVAGYNYRLGSYNDVTTDYYLYSEKDDTVYTTDYQVYYYFAKSLYDIGQWKDVPALLATDITSIVITDADGEVFDVTEDADAREFITTLAFTEVTDYCSDASHLTEYELDAPRYTIAVEYSLDGADGGYTLLVGKLVAEIQRIGSDGSLSPDQYFNVKFADDDFVQQMHTMYLAKLSPEADTAAASDTDAATPIDSES